MATFEKKEDGKYVPVVADAPTFEMPQFLPRVGYNCQYLPVNDNEFKDKGPKVALISHVHDDGTVNLTVFHHDHSGLVHRAHVPLQADGVTGNCYRFINPFSE